MDTEFLKALQSSVNLWIDTERAGTPNVCVPIDKLEGFLAHLADLESRGHANKVVADAALYQLSVQDEKLDRAEAKIESLTDG